MSWQARLSLQYHRNTLGQTVLRHQHQGPLRIFKSLYPEGPGVCHNVMVHPPGGLVQGDCLDVDVAVDAGAHALVSTPGATRFYKSSTGATAQQRVNLRLAQDARLEWLPLETIAYGGCAAVNRLELDLAPGAELMFWDVVSLGLPAAHQPFVHGYFEQHMVWPGRWLERARIAGDDRLLLDSPLGLNGHSTLATLVLACGSALTRGRRETLLEVGREVVAGSPLEQCCGITCPNEHMLVARALAHQVEPVMALWQALWRAWRREIWSVADMAPRIWRV